MRFGFSGRQAALALLVFGVEVGIARFAHDRFIRPYVGDALVVVLIHAAVLSFVDLPRVPAAVGAFFFACAIEVGQYFDLVRLLHLEGVPLARIVVGTSYDPHDFLAYAAGTAVLIAVYRFNRRRSDDRER